MYLLELKKIIEKIIKNIEEKKYYNASVLIRNYLNNNEFNNFWYKDINFIIDNQISNLFYDIDNNTNLCLEFFEHQIVKINMMLKLIAEKKI